MAYDTIDLLAGSPVLYVGTGISFTEQELPFFLNAAGFIATCQYGPDLSAYAGKVIRGWHFKASFTVGGSAGGTRTCQLGLATGLLAGVETKIAYRESSAYAAWMPNGPLELEDVFLPTRYPVAEILPNGAPGSGDWRGVSLRFITNNAATSLTTTLSEATFEVAEIYVSDPPVLEVVGALPAVLPTDEDTIVTFSLRYAEDDPVVGADIDVFGAGSDVTTEQLTRGEDDGLYQIRVRPNVPGFFTLYYRASVPGSVHEEFFYFQPVTGYSISGQSQWSFTAESGSEEPSSCFWTDLLNVTQECEDDEDDEDQAGYNILYDDGSTWMGGDGYDPYYLSVALPFNLSADVWTSYPAVSTSVLEDKTDGYFGAYLFLFFGYNYPDSGWPGDRLFFVIRDTRTGTNLFAQDMEALGQSVVRMEIDFDVDLPAPAWAFEVGFAETENGPLISFANEPTYEVNSTRAMAIVHKKSRRGIRVDFIGVASSTPVENEVFRYGGEDVPFDGPPPLYDVSTAGLVGAMLLSEEPQRGDYVDSELFVWRPAHDPIWLDAGVSEGEFVLYDYNLMTALGLGDPVPSGTWVLGCFMHDHAPTFHRRGVLFIAFQVP